MHSGCLQHRFAQRYLSLTVTALGLLVLSPTARALDADLLYEKLSPSVWVVRTYDAEGVKMGHGSAVVIGKETLDFIHHGLALAPARLL